MSSTMNFEDVFYQKIGSLHFFYLYKYYPYDEINDQTLAQTDIGNRYLIWDFKNSPDKERKPEDVLRARNIIIERLCQLLSKIDKDWSNVVLLCLPASTQEAYEARYKEFSDTLCNRMGLINGYEYIHYIEDGTPKHEGGDGKPIYDIDYEKLNNKEVIILDDVITRGYTILHFKSRLELMDINVIAGICIGKTFHQKDVDDWETVNYHLTDSYPLRIPKHIRKALVEIDESGERSKYYIKFHPAMFGSKKKRVDYNCIKDIPHGTDILKYLQVATELIYTFDDGGTFSKIYF